LSDLKPSAIAVAFFSVFVLPFGTFYIAPLVFGLVTGKTSGDVPVALALFWVLRSFAAPVLRSARGDYPREGAPGVAREVALAPAAECGGGGAGEQDGAHDLGAAGA